MSIIDIFSEHFMCNSLVWLNNMALLSHILQILRKCGGCVQLVDVSSELPQLVRRPGLKKWKVTRDFPWVRTWSFFPVYSLMCYFYVEQNSGVHLFVLPLLNRYHKTKSSTLPKFLKLSSCTFLDEVTTEEIHAPY